ncbi:helix-turn-helix domain-containing protein [Zhihengliuella halotolerans]|uniref:Helix-turn-helix protein n=1 Tax=Zhihengliuella halotolerans TaxID=370736 RepID=A0A4Q8AIK8_9MICC|nr:helix-turn-helix transcriptional regulator [Zhihengliuella halotolerans]RZU63615.1 helix-turn-helix protein [Zhihengliuella halotolerans]
MSEQLRRVGASMRARRIELGLSQVEFCEQLGIDRSRISAIERGVPGRSAILAEVADALGMDLFALPREDRRAASVRAEDVEAASNRRVARSRQ